ncbi:MAG: GatB/YqeY domain-containing protein [Planctomycetes bacterium]|nr:GatB/YqeY domain-containing protein [Planctomycetota bacterium]
MTVRLQLENDVKTAMKSGDNLTRDTLRMILGHLKKLDVDLGRAVTDEDVLGVLASGVKTRQQSVVEFAKAGREELAAKERAEIEILRRYLPKQLSDDETRAVVQKLIAELSLTSKADVGRLMKEAMARHKGLVDGKLVQKLAAELLP